jgi:hypothetical protein
MTAAPLTYKIRTTIPALGAAVNGDQTIGKAPFAGTVTAASFTPEANVTGDNTNTRTLTIINKGQDGNGTTVVATLALTTGVNLTDFNEQAFTLSVVANATTVAADDVLAVAEVIAASGLANPGGSIEVEITRA